MIPFDSTIYKLCTHDHVVYYLIYHTISFIYHVLSNSSVVLFSRVPPKMNDARHNAAKHHRNITHDKKE